MFVKSRSYW